MNEKKINAKCEVVKLLLVFAIEICIMIGTTVVVQVLETTSNKSISMLTISVVLYALLIATILVYTSIKGEKFLPSLGFKKIKASTVFFTVLLTIVSGPMVTFANLLSQMFVPNTVLQASDDILGSNFLMSFIATAIIAPIAEEIICRGFFANRLRKYMPLLATAIVSALLFAILHLNINQAFYAFVLGIIFVYANNASGSIFTSIIMHMLTNGGNLLLLYCVSRFVSQMGGNLAELSEQGRANQSSMVTSLVFFGVLSIGSFFLSRMVINAIARNEGNLPETSEAPIQEGDVKGTTEETE